MQGADAVVAKSELILAGLRSGRGAWARPFERARIARLVEELEGSTSGETELRGVVHRSVTRVDYSRPLLVL